MVSKDTLKGYILEEILAYLIRNTGYKLLVDVLQDPRELVRRGNGLRVKGRGSTHQADVLGQLRWIPAFTFPIRLFVEAKFRNKKTGIDVIRNAVGVLADVNQNNFPTLSSKFFYPKYQYVFSVFSTSGFSPDATKMAVAHQISLIDLNIREFDALRHAIETAVESIFEGEDVRAEDNDRLIEENNVQPNVKVIRFVIRRELGTWPLGVPFSEEGDVNLIPKIGDLLDTTRSYGELFVGMVNGPFMLLLSAENKQDFIEYAKLYPRHKVAIRWGTQNDDGRTWRIVPVDSESRHQGYQLSFRLPEVLAKYIFGTQSEIQERAYKTKERIFSDITIYRHDDGDDHLFRLEYDPEETRRMVEEERFME